MLDFLSKEKCSGCTACVSICPKSSIDMVPAQDGFLYPQVITDTCIKCGLCEKVCPVLHKPEFAHIDPIAGAMRTLDDKVWKNSSSGGAFYELSKHFFELYPNDSLIFAARFEGTHLIHSAFSSISEILPFQKSKYLQSDIRGVFKLVKEKLTTGKHVLFIGTPCQVAGLRNYLCGNWSNLVCVDFVCHGVGSPGFFDSFIKYLENRNKKSISSYEFRTKKGTFGNYSRYCSKIVYGDGEIEFNDKYSYISIFLKQLCTRKICNGDCPFRDIKRQGDITLADFNGKSIVYPDLCDEKNYSAIVFNTAVGEAFKQTLIKETKYFDCDIKQIMHFNPLIYKNVPGNPERDAFMEKFSKGLGYSELVKLAKIKKTSLSNKLLKLVPWKAKFRIYQLYRMVRK